MIIRRKKSYEPCYRLLERCEPKSIRVPYVLAVAVVISASIAIRAVW